MSDFGDILKQNEQGQPMGNNKPIGDKLLAYLEGSLPPAEQREVEEWINRGGMESDAVDGLKELGAVEARGSIYKLDAQLKKSLKKRKTRNTKAGLELYVIIAFAIVFLMVVLGYFLIHMSVNKI